MPPEKPTVLCLIPARGGSKRIPRKNIRPFHGRPAIEYPIDAAFKAGCFDEVMVSTDDAEIAEVARRAGATVPFLRSTAASSDTATMADVVFDVLGRYAEAGRHFQIVCSLYPIAVLVTARRLLEGYRMLLTEPAPDAVIPVVRFGYPIQRALRIADGRLAMCQPEHINTRSQDLEPAYHDAAQFYWMCAEAFRRHRTVWMPNAAPLMLDETEVQDIDHETDWQIAELKWLAYRT